MSNNKTVKWKRFTRASYAVFNSLHKEMAIGVLSVAMIHCADMKAKTPAMMVAVGGNGVSLVADDATLDSASIALGDLEVLGTRVPLTQSQAPRMVTVLTAADVAAAAVHSINDLLEYAVGVDVRQRGELGVQTDISVRGGTFDQITLLLNGINISSPHTGHLSADFPVTMDDIERIEVVEGPAARVFGTSAFTGVVNIVTRQRTSADAIGGVLHLKGGGYGYAGGDLRLDGTHRVGEHGTMSHALSGGYSRSDGATDNSDYTNTHFFYQGTYTTTGVKVNAQLGYSYKPYGANTFYGASSTDQWESNERFMAAIKAETQIGRLHLMPQLYWNRWNDHYQWHKGTSPSGENFHQVDVYGLAVNSWFETTLGKTSFGIEMRSDGIWSTNLGKPLEEDQYRFVAGKDGTHERQYTKRDERTNVSAYLEHDILLQDWTISLGVMANHNTGLDERWRFYPGVDIAYRPSEAWKLFASWNMALRMPTYTDLYYSGKNIEGTSNLKPEKTNDVSLGAKYRRQGWDVQGQAFYSHKSDMIDWVVYEDEYDPQDYTYRSGNFTLDNYGVELQASLLPRELFGEKTFLRCLSASYAYISENIAHPRAVAMSKYAQEYLRHKVVLQADGRVWRNLLLSLSWRWQDRVGEDNLPYALCDAKLSWNDRRFQLYVDCSNLFNKEYYDYSIVRQPGRWIKGGVIMRF